MKLRDTFRYEIERYIQEAYLEYRDGKQTYFQLQFVEVIRGFIERSGIYSQHVRKIRLEYDKEHSVNKTQQAYCSSLKVSPQHKKAKARKSQHRKQNYSQIKG